MSTIHKGPYRSRNQFAQTYLYVVCASSLIVCRGLKKFPLLERIILIEDLYKFSFLFHISRSNTFHDSKTSNSILTSPHSDDEDDYVLDIHVGMGVESTYDDDGYRDESDDLLSEPTPDLKNKSHGLAVIELDSSPEKSPKKRLSRDHVEKSQDPELEAKHENEEESSQDIHDAESLKVPPKAAEDKHGNKEAGEDDIVPIEKKDVPIDEKIKISENLVSSDNIPKEQISIHEIAEQPSINLNDVLEAPNEVSYNDHQNNEDIRDDTRPTESMDFINEIVMNSPKTDLKESTDKVENESKTSRINKRRRSSSFSTQEHDSVSNINQTTDPKNQEEGLPAKKLKAELETIFPKHNKVLTDYINKTSNETVDNIQSHINQLLVDIQTLNEMIKTNENEWNNMIYLKKMKEEICIRLTRKKQTIQLESRKIGDISALFSDLTSDETLMPKNDEIDNDKQRGPQLSSTPLHNKSNSATSQNLSEQVSNILDGFDRNCKSFSQSAANMLIQNRANMKSSELAKEKLNMQKVHR